MAESAKGTFAADTFGSATFACGTFRGLGAPVGPPGPICGADKPEWLAKGRLQWAQTGRLQWAKTGRPEWIANRQECC